MDRQRRWVHWWNCSNAGKGSLRLTPLLLVVSLGKNTQLRGVSNQEHQQNQLRVAKLLLQYGARPNAKDVLGKTVFHYGAGQMAKPTTLQIADYCLSANESTYLLHQIVELHGLTQTAMNGQRGVVTGYHVDTGRRAVQLLNDNREVAIKPENLRLIDNDGRPLATPPVVRLCDVQDRLGGTSLLEVVIGANEDVAQWLLDRNAKIDVADCDGMSPKKMSMSGAGQMTNKVCQLIREHALKSARHERRKQCTHCGKDESELAPLSLCSVCKVPRYCSKDCQLTHWKSGHKKECQELVTRKSEGVRLERPAPAPAGEVSYWISPSGGPAQSSGSYMKPQGVNVGELFPIKVQARGSDPSTGCLLIYDETRECMFDLNHDQQGFRPLWDAVKAEMATHGTKTFMKALFDPDGNCIAFPGATRLSTW